MSQPVNIQIKFPPPQLVPEQVQKAMIEFRSWAKANEIAIVTAESEAAKAAGIQTLAQFFLQHGGELLGAWFTIHHEYEPLVTALAPVMRHVSNLMTAQNQAAQAQAAEAFNKRQKAGNAEIVIADPESESPAAKE